jgi:hypothetical protein
MCRRTEDLVKETVAENYYLLEQGRRQVRSSTASNGARAHATGSHEPGGTG